MHPFTFSVAPFTRVKCGNFYRAQTFTYACIYSYTIYIIDAVDTEAAIPELYI